MNARPLPFSRWPRVQAHALICDSMDEARRVARDGAARARKRHAKDPRIVVRWVARYTSKQLGARFFIAAVVVRRKPEAQP